MRPFRCGPRARWRLAAPRNLPWRRELFRGIAGAIRLAPSILTGACWHVHCNSRDMAIAISSLSTRFVPAQTQSLAPVLVVYGTTNGQAGKIARFIGDTIRATGLEAQVVDAAGGDPDPAVYSAIIVVASIHAGGYQRAVQRWVARRVATLAAAPTAFVSVCLGVLQHDAQVERDLTSILQRFQSATGWAPDVSKLVAGALSYTQYGWVTRLVMRRIARKAGGSTDTSRDHEYTDWNDLRAFVEMFARTVVNRCSRS